MGARDQDEEPSLDQNNNVRDRLRGARCDLSRCAARTGEGRQASDVGPQPALAPISSTPCGADHKLASLADSQQRFGERVQHSLCATTATSRHSAGARKSQQEDCLSGPLGARPKEREPPASQPNKPNDPYKVGARESSQRVAAAAAKDADCHSPSDTEANRGTGRSLDRYASSRHEPRMIRYLGSMQVRSEQKATKVLGVVFFTFVICWSPFFMVNFAQGFVRREQLSQWISNEMMTTFLWLGYISSTINPVIYTVFNRDFRRAFRRLLLCREPVGRRQYRQSRGSEYYRSFHFSQFRSNRHSHGHGHHHHSYHHHHHQQQPQPQQPRQKEIQEQLRTRQSRSQSQREVALKRKMSLTDQSSTTTAFNRTRASSATYNAADAQQTADATRNECTVTRECQATNPSLALNIHDGRQPKSSGDLDTTLPGSAPAKPARPSHEIQTKTHEPMIKVQLGLTMVPGTNSNGH